MDEELAAEIARFGAVTQDPVWRLPLWDPYDKLLEGKIADLTNISGGPFACSITAALFLAASSHKTQFHFRSPFPRRLRWSARVSPGFQCGGFIQRCLQKAMQWISPKFL